MVFRISTLGFVVAFQRKSSTKAAKENSVRAVGELSVEFIQWQFEIR
jgi:hypothetical protein